MEDKKKLVVGILAHVDAGKTTLSEAMLYLCGQIRKLGRVDRKNTYLDSVPMERERGITIFSKQARLSTEGMDLILLDTPGHTDFSTETERTLQVLDYAILVISGTDGVQNHTLTLWDLLKTYSIPTFLFVNKMDMQTKGERELSRELRENLSMDCFPIFSEESVEERMERVATLSESLLEDYLESGTVDPSELAQAVANRELFPCCFGSALSLTGVSEFLNLLEKLTLNPVYPASFGARVYKIMRDGHLRMTCLKLTGGSLKVRDELSYLTASGEPVSEKISQIRLYSGDKFVSPEEVKAGEICTVLGLSETYSGQGLGKEADGTLPILEPVMTYSLNLPPECDVRVMFPKLKQLEEEDPSLHLTWQEETRQIRVQLMGEVQIEVLERLISQRFGICVKLDTGKIVYKETVRSPVEGIGHYEPLRHYAEVHILIEPLPCGSGIVIDTQCPENNLDRNWQRLIMTHLGEKVHRGVLTGAPLTDVKLTLLAGRAHLEHTEGGDFRQATYRAVRQGLMQAQSQLLEPYYRYRLEIPTSDVGRAMVDLEQMSAEINLEAPENGMTAISGKAPVSEMQDYPRQVRNYTKDRGRLYCRFDSYGPCHNAEQVIAEANYDPDSDMENPSYSVFCKRGVGFPVPWNQVREYMHVESGYSMETKPGAPLLSLQYLTGKYEISDEELEALMQREFGPMKRRKYSEPKEIKASVKKAKPYKKRKQILIVDGYNVIFSWDSLKSLAETNLPLAREQLMTCLGNYVGYTGSEITLVFDGYRVKGNVGERFLRDGFRVIYTKEDETADTCIERLVHEMGPSYDVRAVTSDRLIQISALQAGVLRMSSAEFEREVRKTELEIRDFLRKIEEQNEMRH